MNEKQLVYNTLLVLGVVAIPIFSQTIVSLTRFFVPGMIGLDEARSVGGMSNFNEECNGKTFFSFFTFWMRCDVHLKIQW